MARHFYLFLCSSILFCINKIYNTIKLYRNTKLKQLDVYICPHGTVMNLTYIVRFTIIWRHTVSDHTSNWCGNMNYCEDNFCPVWGFLIAEWGISTSKMCSTNYLGENTFPLHEYYAGQLRRGCLITTEKF